VSGHVASAAGADGMAADHDNHGEDDASAAAGPGAQPARQVPAATLETAHDAFVARLARWLADVAMDGR
jgi:hypothetical protein